MSKKRETVDQKLERILDAKLAEYKTGSTVTGCTFRGVEYNDKFTDIAQTIAEGFIANANGLTELSKVLSSSNITVEACLKVEN